MTWRLRDRSSRGAFIAGAAAAGAAPFLLDMSVTSTRAAELPARPRATAIQSILNTALIAEQLATTFYYRGLTSPAVMHSHRLGGPSADPNNPGTPPGGTPSNVRDLQSCLDAEVKHAAALMSAGATSPYKTFYFPATTFHGLGHSRAPATFLGVMEILESTFVRAYIAAVNEVLQVGRPDLAAVIAQIMGVEAEHRVLARIIDGVDPANDLTLERAPFGAVSQVGTALQPFLTGKGFAGGATQAVPLPTNAQTRRVVGKYTTRFVTRFL